MVNGGWFFAAVCGLSWVAGLDSSQRSLKRQTLRIHGRKLNKNFEEYLLNLFLGTAFNFAFRLND